MRKSRNFFTKYYNRLREKGHQRLTFMIVPHSKKHIYDFHVTKLTVFFIVFIVFAVITASLLSMRLQDNIRGEVHQLYKASELYYNERKEYLSKLDELIENQNEVKDKLYFYYQETDFHQADLPDFFSEDFLRREASEQLFLESKDLITKINVLQNKQFEKDVIFSDEEKNLLTAWEKNQITKEFLYNNDVILYRILGLEMKQTIKALNQLQKMLNERTKVQRSLPYYWPVAGGRFTSFYGQRLSPFGYTSEFHLGVDLADRVGTPLFASADGVVISRGYAGGYGLRLILQHDFGYQTLYAHLNRARVRVGDKVKKGQVIGEIGKSGQVTGPHLHYEIRIQDKQVNPLPYLSAL
ncbi:MAG: M23 family metallopeptidase [Spirochaetia bacterium]|nr:M23 family metallopeptidase [Spirochaetia bacterium]